LRQILLVAADDDSGGAAPLSNPIDAVRPLAGAAMLIAGKPGEIVLGWPGGPDPGAR
jgi:hypothetical protein